MTKCKGCAKDIKTEKEYIKCAGKCNSAYHNDKNCCALSASASNYLKKYTNLIYLCNDCKTTIHEIPKVTNDNNKSINESLNLIDKQSENIHSIKTNVYIIKKVLEEQESPQDYTDKFEYINNALHKIISKINKLELDQQMLKEIKKNNDVLVLKLQKLIDDYDNKANNFEILFNKLDDLAIKLESMPATTNNFELFNPPLTFDTEYAVLQINNKIDEIHSKLCPTLNLQAEFKLVEQKEADSVKTTKSNDSDNSSGWRFINGRSKKVWKKQWPNDNKQQHSKVNPSNKKSKSASVKNNNNSKPNVNIAKQSNVIIKKNVNDNRKGSFKNKGNNRTKQTINKVKNPIDIDNFDSIINEYGHNNNMKYPNFISGGIINPAKPPIHSHMAPPSYVNPLTSQNASVPNGGLINTNVTRPSFIDPLAPPRVKVTQNLSNNFSADNRYLLSRFRDQRIYDKARYFLAYFFDKTGDVCYKGMTKLNITMALKSEGLPTDVNELKHLYFNYHMQSDGLNVVDVQTDLEALRKHISKERTNFLQVSSENYKKFYYPSHRKFF